MIAVVDYGMGNLHSVRHALATVGANVQVTSEPKDLERAERIVARDPGRGLPRSGGEAGGRSGVPQAQAQAQAPFACDEREERA